MEPRESSAQERLEHILSNYTAADPDRSETELLVLAQLADDLSSLRPDALSSEARAALRIRVLTSVTAELASRPRASFPWWRHGLVRSRAALVGAAAVVTLVGGGVGALSAGAASLPGDSLYALKLARENVALTLATSDAARATAYADQAAHRLDEARRLNGMADPSAIEALTASAQRAIDRSTALATQPGAGSDLALRTRLQALEQQRLALQAQDTAHGRPAAAPGQLSRQDATPTPKEALDNRGNAAPADAHLGGADGDAVKETTPNPEAARQAGGASSHQDTTADGNADGHGQPANGAPVPGPADDSQAAHGHPAIGQPAPPDPTTTKANDGNGNPPPNHAPGADQRQPTKTPSSGAHGKP